MSAERPVIVCLGDSTTAGTPLFKSPVEAPPDGEGNEQSQFPWWLRQMRPSWTVHNAGVNGERTDQIVRRFDRDVLAHAPDVVVIIAGVNDVYQGRGVDWVTHQLESLYARAHDAGIPIVAGSIVPYNTATVDQNKRMHEINTWIANAAVRRTGFWFANTRRVAADLSNPDRLAGSPDDLHPDIAGYKRMAETLRPAIEMALRSQVQGPGSGA